MNTKQGRKTTELAKTQKIARGRGHRLHAVVVGMLPQYLKALGKQIQEQHPGTRRSRN